MANMKTPKLTWRSVEVRAVSVPLRRPVISKVGLFESWPMILIDLATEEGITGRSYLEPYLAQSARYLCPAIRDLAAARIGQPLRPVDDFQAMHKSLNLVGYEGMSLIAVSGLDMAAWDALAQAARLPLAEYLGGSLGRVPAYNSNGLWLTDVGKLADEAAALVAEGSFTGLKLRLGRERLADDLAAIAAVRGAAGEEVKLMVDFNQGLSFGDALARCHALDDEELYWLEEPIAYDNLAGFARLTRELATPIQLYLHMTHRLQPGTEFGRGLANSLRHCTHLARILGDQRDDPIGFTQLVRAQNNANVPIERHQESTPPNRRSRRV